MHKGRIEAFSDGVIAIIITIMVLELKPPHGAQLAELLKESNVFLAYALSFVYVAIYWNNHHHLFQAVHKVNGPVLWANVHLLFWLSLTPFGTNWIGKTNFAAMPVAVYGFILLMSGVAYYVLCLSLLNIHPKDSVLAKAIGSDVKGKISMVIYLAAIPVAIVAPIVSCLLFLVVAIVWLLPDRRIERLLSTE